MSRPGDNRRAGEVLKSTHDNKPRHDPGRDGTNPRDHGDFQDGVRTRGELKLVSDHLGGNTSGFGALTPFWSISKYCPPAVSNKQITKHIRMWTILTHVFTVGACAHEVDINGFTQNFVVLPCKISRAPKYRTNARTPMMSSTNVGPLTHEEEVRR